MLEIVTCLFFYANSGEETVIEQFVFSRFENFKESNKLNCSIEGRNGNELASRWMIYIELATILPGIIVSFYLGSYGDSYGRKLGFLLPASASMIKCFIWSMVIHFNLNIWLLILGCVIQGLGGGRFTLMMSAFSSIAETTIKEQRSFRIMLLHGLLAFTATVSNIISGIVISKFGYVTFFFVIESVYAVSFLSTFFISEKNHDRKSSKVFSVKYIKNSFELYLKDNGTPRRKFLLISVVISLLAGGAWKGRKAPITFFLKSPPLCWNAFPIGLFWGIFIFWAYLTSTLLTKFLDKLLSDYGLILMGCTMSIISIVVFAFSKTIWFVYLSVFLAIGIGCIIPIINSTNSKLVNDDEQGALFSGIAFTECIFSLYGTIAFNALYSSTSNIFRPTMFLVNAFFYVLAGLLTV